MGKIKQRQDELEVTDQQITVLNPQLHLDTLDVEQQQRQEKTQPKGKFKQPQDELKVIDQQITALNPLLHLDTLRQRCKQ